MSDAHSSHEDNGPHEGPIKTPKQLVLAVVFAFVVPILAIALLVKFVTADVPEPPENNSQRAEEAGRRIAPVGQVAIGAAPLTTPAAVAPVVAKVEVAAANTTGAPALYTQTCAVCHAAGIAGAPKLGDKTAWAPRIGQGLDALTASAIKGKNAMPPKGGSTASDSDIKSAVAYMVNAAK